MRQVSKSSVNNQLQKILQRFQRRFQFVSRGLRCRSFGHVESAKVAFKNFIMNFMQCREGLPCRSNFDNKGGEEI